MFRPLREEDIEDLGLFETLPDAERRFVPPAPPRRPAADPTLAARAGLEMPVLYVWGALTLFVNAPAAWVLWGVLLILAQRGLRTAYRARGLGWLYHVYVAVGLGQVLFGLSRVADLSLFQPLLILYAGAVAVTWIGLELRYQARADHSDPIPPTQEDRIYYVYG